MPFVALLLLRSLNAPCSLLHSLSNSLLSLYHLLSFLLFPLLVSFSPFSNLSFSFYLFLTLPFLFFPDFLLSQFFITISFLFPPPHLSFTSRSNSFTFLISPPPHFRPRPFLFYLFSFPYLLPFLPKFLALYHFLLALFSTLSFPSISLFYHTHSLPLTGLFVPKTLFFHFSSASHLLQFSTLPLPCLSFSSSPLCTAISHPNSFPIISVFTFLFFLCYLPLPLLHSPPSPSLPSPFFSLPFPSTVVPAI